MLSIGSIVEVIQNTIKQNQEFYSSTMYAELQSKLVEKFEQLYKGALASYLKEVNATEHQKAANRNKLAQRIQNIENQLDELKHKVDPRYLPDEALGAIKSWFVEPECQETLVQFTGFYPHVRAANFYLIRWWIDQAKDYTTAVNAHRVISNLLNTENFQPIFSSGSNRLTEQLKAVLPEAQKAINLFNAEWANYQRSNDVEYRKMLAEAKNAIIPASSLFALFCAKAQQVSGSDSLLKEYSCAITKWEKYQALAARLNSEYALIKKEVDALKWSYEPFVDAAAIYSDFLDKHVYFPNNELEELNEYVKSPDINTNIGFINEDLLNNFFNEKKAKIQAVATVKFNESIEAQVQTKRSFDASQEASRKLNQWGVEHAQQNMVSLFLKGAKSNEEYLKLFESQMLELAPLFQRLSFLPIFAQLKKNLLTAVALAEPVQASIASVAPRGNVAEKSTIAEIPGASSAPVLKDAMAGAGVPVELGYANENFEKASAIGFVESPSSPPTPSAPLTLLFTHELTQVDEPMRAFARPSLLMGDSRSEENPVSPRLAGAIHSEAASSTSDVEAESAS